MTFCAWKKVKLCFGTPSFIPKLNMFKIYFCVLIETSKNRTMITIELKLCL